MKISYIFNIFRNFGAFYNFRGLLCPIFLEYVNKRRKSCQKYAKILYKHTEFSHYKTEIIPERCRVLRRKGRRRS